MRVLIYFIFLLFFYKDLFATCEYKSNSKVLYQHEVESIRNQINQSLSHIEGTRKCIVNIEVLIDNQWYQVEGKYIYGEHLSEKEACKYAKEKAINNILAEVSPVEVNSNEQLTCFQGANIAISKNDLVSEKVNGKICKRVYFDARIRNTLGKVWGYYCR